MNGQTLHGGKFSLPMIRGDGKEVLIQIRVREGFNLKIQVPTKELEPLINQLANIHIAAKTQEKLPSKLKTFDGEEFGPSPEVHVSRKGQVIYIDGSEPLVQLRIQSEEGKELLIVFADDDFQRICNIVRMADKPQDFSDSSN